MHDAIIEITNVAIEELRNHGLSATIYLRYVLCYRSIIDPWMREMTKMHVER